MYSSNTVFHILGHHDLQQFYLIMAVHSTDLGSSVCKVGVKAAGSAKKNYVTGTILWNNMHVYNKVTLMNVEIYYENLPMSDTDV